MFDWLISGGASLLSGFLSMGSEKARDRENAKRVKEANDRNEKRVQDMNADVRKRAEAAAELPIIVNQQGGVDVTAMMAGAEAAGFNPVTWLRNGAMQAYSWTSQQTWNSQKMDAALAGSTIFQESAPALETARGPGEVLGSALQTGASAWVAEAQQQRQNAFQLALVDAQLTGANRAGNVGPRSGYVPTAFLGGSHATANNSAALGGSTMWSGVIDANGKPLYVPDQENVPSPELYLTTALAPWINPKDAGHPSTAFQHMGDSFINDFWIPFTNRIPKVRGPRQGPPLPAGYTRPNDWVEPIL